MAWLLPSSKAIPCGGGFQGAPWGAAIGWKVGTVLGEEWTLIGWYLYPYVGLYVATPYVLYFVNVIRTVAKLHHVSQSAGRLAGRLEQANSSMLWSIR